MKFNLSDWALEHRSLVWYFLLVVVLFGAFSYVNLGRQEDPDFTINTMLVSLAWPGATADDVATQVAERVERKLQDLPALDHTESTTTAGLTVINITLRDSVSAAMIRPTFVEVRNMVNDITSSLPSGVQAPVFNDHFGDVFGNIYAFTGDGLSQRQLRDYVESVRSRILTLPDVGQVDVIGAQNEAIYLEVSPQKLAALGLNMTAVVTAIQQQNEVSPSGVLQAGPERIAVRVGGQFTSEQSLANINLNASGKFVRLSDIATIRRGYADPPSSLFRFDGQPAIGLAIGMRAGGNLLNFGKALEADMARLQNALPAGVTAHLVSDQPQVVREAISSFTNALLEAVGIVLIVSFISLGLRAGLVVAITIPVVLAVTFLVMSLMGIALQRISLGALIIALGLLVDDAMIAVEMMASRLEAGDTLRKAATSVYTSTAFPMLTGTLVTVFGFIPIGLNASSAGQYTFSLFAVLAIALLASWVVAVVFTPLIGVTLLPKTIKSKHHGPGIFARAFGAALSVCMRFRWLTIAATLGAFALSIFGMGFVQQQFFPASDRPEVIVDWVLPQNGSIAQTDQEMAQIEKEALAGNPDIVRWSSYVGQPAPRFVLTLSGPGASPSAGQTIILTKGPEVRDKVKAELQAYLKKTFPGTDAFVKALDLGPPVGRPIQYRVSGPDVDQVRSTAYQLAAAIGTNPNLGDVAFDWMTPARVIKTNVLQDKARELGISPVDIANALHGLIDGVTVTSVQDAIYQVPVVTRAQNGDRNSLDTLRNLTLSGSNGQTIPLSVVATFSYAIEQPTIVRRNRVPTITISAGLATSLQAATVSSQIAPAVDKIRADLPVGYTIEAGGSAESSANSSAPILDAVPIMLFLMATILMMQLQKFSRLFLVVAIAPLALIGVVAALLITGRPLGFVAVLGVLALIGILIRNSVILVVQIETMRASGVSAWQSVFEATQHRARPILLTALAASFGLLPIVSEIFWGPMAVAMMGGILVGTVLTLLFLPALYVVWFRIKPDVKPAPAADAEVPEMLPA
jgi:multidrug efflux pump subunit AcrB